MFGGVGVCVEVMFAVAAIAQLISCHQGPPHQPLPTSMALHNINAISYLAGAKR